MVPVKLALNSLLLISVFVFFGCKEREITNPFDAACPKGLFTPTDFKAEQAGNAVKLTWEQGNTQISGFIINRNENDGTFAEAARVDKTILVWNDNNVVGGKKYGYQLYAYAADNLSNAQQVTITPLSGAIVSTTAASGIGPYSAVLGGTVSSDGGTPVTQRGVCYNTSANPTTANSKLVIGNGTGEFSNTVSGLIPNTNYYVKAYAINSQGTTYGSEVSFTTSTVSLSVSPAIYNVAKEAGSRVFTVSSNIDWQVSSNQSWCTLNVTSGKGNSPVIATFNANTVVGQRSAALTFSGVGVSNQLVAITQEGTEPAALSITPDNRNVINTAGTTTFTITSNVAWTATSDQTWCTIENASGSGNGALTVNYDANTSNSQKVATLSVTGLGLTAKTVTITQQPPIPTEGLVAYYPFNGNANDESGNGKNGTVSGATLTTDRKGNLNRAYLFNGGSNVIKASPTLPTGNAARTVSVWFKTTSSSGSNGWGCNSILSWGNSTDSHICSPIIYQGKLIIGFYGSSIDVETNKIVNDGIWHHVCFTYVQQLINVYLDGKFIISASRTINTSSSELCIGQRVDQSNQAMNGSIDDIRIYNRALTETEVQQLYNE